MITNPDEPAFPIVGENPGLTKLEHFASQAKDDFSELPMALQISITESSPPRFSLDDATRDNYNLEYAEWVAKGRARWKVIQALQLVEQLNEYHNCGL